MFTLYILTQTKEIICKIPELFLAPISEWQCKSYFSCVCSNKLFQLDGERERKIYLFTLLMFGKGCPLIWNLLSSILLPILIQNLICKSKLTTLFCLLIISNDMIASQILKTFLSRYAL